MFNRDNLEVISFQLKNLIYRIFLNKNIFHINDLKIFINVISQKNKTTIIKKLLNKNFLIKNNFENFKLVSNLNFQEIYYRKHFIKYIEFPFLKKFKITKNKNKLLKMKIISDFFNLKKKKSIFLFFKEILLKKQNKTNLQTTLFLKSTGLIEEGLDLDGFKTSTKGIKILFKTLEIQLSRILEFYRFDKFYFYSKNFSQNFYPIFYRIRISENKFLAKKGFLSDFLEKIKNNQKFKPQLLHIFPKEFFQNFYISHFLGILFIPCFLDKIFYSSPVLKHFSGEKSQLRERKKLLDFKNFYIIIESNYRIYAYQKRINNSEILLIFSDVLYILPNFFVGEITEKSISRAIRNGVSVKNIFGFINENLHWICNSIPLSVLNQVKLWEFQMTKIKVFDFYFIIENKREKNQKKKNVLLFEKKQKILTKTQSFFFSQQGQKNY